MPLVPMLTSRSPICLAAATPQLVDDPDEMEAQLRAQLSAMSLYASQTSGDGNCLFRCVAQCAASYPDVTVLTVASSSPPTSPHRALSDQFYGSPNHHARLRQEICDYLEASPDRFAGFVDIEKPFEEYVKTMRQNGELLCMHRRSLRPAC